MIIYLYRDKDRDGNKNIERGRVKSNGFRT